MPVKLQSERMETMPLKNTKYFSRFINALWIVVAFTGPVSYAQERGILEEIIVTAQKREQDIQDVPISVATLSDENLNAIMGSGVDVLALTARLPSLYVETSNGRVAPRFYIRGLGNIAFDQNASQPVSVVYDDVVLENVTAKVFPLFDIESVEILRGPQGTLFGRNTPAGVVKFESARPTEEFEGYLDVSYGRHDFRNVEAAISGALSPGVLTGRASILYNGRGDYIDNIAVGYEENDAFGGFEEIAGRVQLHWTPSDATSVLLNVGYHNLFHGPNGFLAGLFRAGEGFTGVDRGVLAHDSMERQASEIEQWNFTGTVKHNFGNVTMTSITGYRNIFGHDNRGDVDGGSITGPIFSGNVPFLRDVLGFGDNWALETGDIMVSHEQVTQELRFAGNEWGRLDWLVGFYYFYEDIGIDQVSASSFTIFGAPPLPAPPLTAQQFQETNAWAVFGSIEYDLTDRLLLQFGLRYSDDDKEHTAIYTALNFNAPAGSPFETDVSDSEVTGDISLTWNMSDEVNFYTRFSRGYKAPSVLARDSVPDVGESETIWSVEGGIKSQFLDNRMRLNITGYYYEMSNQQLPIIGGVTNTIGLINADKTIGHGFEADLEFSPTERVLITAGLSLNETEIDDSTLGIGVCGAACTVLDPPNPAVPGQFLVDGNTLPNAPEWIGNLVFRYGQPVSGGELYFLTDWFFRSEITDKLYDSVEFTFDDRIEGGIRLGYISGNGRWEISAYGRNITNEEAPIVGLDFMDYNSTTFTGSVNDPPTWGIQGKYMF